MSSGTIISLQYQIYSLTLKFIGCSFRTPYQSMVVHMSNMYYRCCFPLQIASRSTVPCLWLVKIPVVMTPPARLAGPANTTGVEAANATGITALTQVNHHNDVTMDTIVSQITSLTIVSAVVYLRRRSKETLKLRVTGLCVWNSPVTGEFPAQRASNAEKVSIWWRHHVQVDLVIKRP